MLIKLCFVRIVNSNGYILFTELVHCENKVQYRFLDSDISVYDFYIENGIVEEMMSLTFLM